MPAPHPRSAAPTVVLGAGISGLTAAHELAAAGHEVIVLDRRLGPGGRIHTERRDGFLVEHGPNTMMSPAPGAEALLDTLGLGAQRIGRGDGVRHRYLVRDARAHALPLNPAGFFGSSFFTMGARLRLLAEPFIGVRHGDETVANFIRRRFGHEMLDYVFDPLIGGLYAGDPEQLSIEALFPHLKRLEREHGSVLRGILAARRAGALGRLNPARRQLFSLRDGLGVLPARLMDTLSGRVRFGVRVEALEALGGGGYRLRLREGAQTSSLHAHCVVVALPAYAAARTLEPLSQPLGDALAGIAHPPLAVVALGLRAADVAHPLDGLGVLTPRREQRATLGMLFSSTLFAGRAPAGHVLLTAYVGGARRPELALLPREALIAAVRDEAADLLGARGQPVFSSVRYWRHGLPQPDLQHCSRLETLRQAESEYPGLFITGNYVAGVSTAACIDAARAVAGRAHAFLVPSRANCRNPVTAHRA
ncbi:MAG: protoporphyrinogen oxidase [Rhodocyclales bacterium]|nr:protoporphyrinogen oxidase [Rhodocyclales bacterium]